MANSWEKLGKVAKSSEKWRKVAKSGEKWRKVAKKCGEKLEKVENSWNKWGRVGKSGEKWGKVGKSGEKWGKVGKSGKKLGIFFPKWPAAAILDDRKSLSIAFLAISDQYATSFFFKMAANSHFGSRFLPKSIGTYLYSRSVARLNMKLIGAFLMKLWSAQAFSSYFHKMAVGGHCGFPIFSKRVLPL